MNITVTTKNGKSYGKVSKGDRVLFQTPGYYTAQMALVAARCWRAFHGEEKAMMHPMDTFEVRMQDHTLRTIDAKEMAKVIANAKRHGVQVSVRQGAGGGEYIDIHNGGSSYGQYFRAGSV